MRGLHRVRAVGAHLVQAAVAVLAMAACAVVVVPRVLGWHGVLVLSGSMAPALEPGGVAFVDRVRPEAIREGAVIAFG